MGWDVTPTHPNQSKIRTRPRKNPLFFEESALRGVSFQVNSDLGEGALMPEIMLGGGAAFDFDDDGWLDLYFIQGSNGANELYRNRGDGTFEQLNEIGDAEDTGYGFGTATADVDADGDVDLFVSNLGKDVLLRNDGDGHFTDVTDLSGLGDIGWGTSATFFDADLDGDPDPLKPDTLTGRFNARDFALVQTVSRGTAPRRIQRSHIRSLSTRTSEMENSLTGAPQESQMFLAQVLE